MSCTANDVETQVVDVVGPVSCMRGEIITVNVTSSIHFRSTRYDFAIYTYAGTLDADGSPVYGENCAVDVLGEDEALLAPRNIKDADGDSCYDVLAQSGYTLENFKFQDNLMIPCDDQLGSSVVHMQNCFSWRVPGQNEDCNVHYAYPGCELQLI